MSVQRYYNENLLHSKHSNELRLKKDFFRLETSFSMRNSLFIHLLIYDIRNLNFKLQGLKA